MVLLEKMNAKSNMNMGREGGEGLARQQSVYSLTFDEFQNTLGGLGKDFGSMNMDELLKSIWTAEESQAIASVAAAPVQTTAVAGQVDGGGVPQRQGSLTLPRTLSQKTVDEVWRDLVYGGGAAGAVNSQMQLGTKRQPTLGEMTLEEFLVRAGVVREGPLRAGGVDINTAAAADAGNSMLFHGQVLSPSVTPGVTHSGFDLKYSQPGGSAVSFLPNPIGNNSAATLPITSSGARPYAAGIATTGLSNPLGAAAAGGIMGFGDPAVAAGLGSAFGPGIGGLGGVSPDLSSDGLGKGNADVDMVSPPVPYVFGSGLRGRKCTAVEKVVERRQRRMIKNRESAARSRARKQAYTMELEAEVAKLKEQNKELQKKQEEIMEKQKNQALELINQQNRPKKISLRRTRTGPW